MGPAGGGDKVRHQAHRRQAGVHLGHAVHHVGHRRGRGVRLVVGNVHRLRVVGAAVLQQLHDAHIGVRVVPVVEDAVILVRFKLLLRRRPLHIHGRLDLDGPGHGPDRQGSLVVRHVVVLGLHCFLHGLRVQDVAENDRLRPEKLEVGVHELAQRIALPVIGKAQLLHRLVPARHQHGDVGLCGLRRRLDRRGPHHKGDAHRCHLRRLNGRSLFKNVYAEFRHCYLPSFPASFSFM